MRLPVLATVCVGLRRALEPKHGVAGKNGTKHSCQLLVLFFLFFCSLDCLYICQGRGFIIRSQHSLRNWSADVCVLLLWYAVWPLKESRWVQIIIGKCRSYNPLLVCGCASLKQRENRRVWGREENDPIRNASYVVRSHWKLCED